MVDSQKLNDWLQVAGMFGIIGTLVFVGVQMKQTQMIALSANYQYQLGFLSEDHWQGSLEEMKCQFELPFYRTLLLGWRFREEFSKLIEQAKREAINNPSGCRTFAPDHPIYN